MATIALNLGIDFGTSFTKVCVRDTSQDRSWVVAFGQNKSCEDNMLSSLIGVMPDGQLVGGLTTKEWERHEKPLISIDFIKIRLAGLPPLDVNYENWQNLFTTLPKFKNIDLNKSGRIRGLAAFYLSRVIWRTKIWIMENNADLIEGNDIIWTAQICVPVKYCDSPLISRFSEIFHLAWLLSEDLKLASGIPPSETLESLGKKIKSLESKLQSKDAACTAMEEIRAALFAPIETSRVGENVEVIFDIGSGTIEGATYQLKRGESGKAKGGTILDYYAAEIEPLGVNAILAHATNDLHGVSATEIEQDLISNSSTLQKAIDTVARSMLGNLQKGEFVISKYRDQNDTLKLSQEAIEKRLKEKLSPQEKIYLKLLYSIGHIHQLVGKVIVKPCRTKAGYRELLTKINSIDILLSGGGSQIELYKDTIASTHTAFNHDRAGIPEYSLSSLSLPSPEKFSMSGLNKKDFHRFSVAYGLSIPEDDFGDFISKLPSQMDERRELPPEEPPLMDDW